MTTEDMLILVDLETMGKEARMLKKHTLNRPDISVSELQSQGQTSSQGPSQVLYYYSFPSFLVTRPNHWRLSFAEPFSIE